MSVPKIRDGQEHRLLFGKLSLTSRALIAMSDACPCLGAWLVQHDSSIWKRNAVSFAALRKKHSGCAMPTRAGRTIRAVGCGFRRGGDARDIMTRAETSICRRARRYLA